MIKSQYRSLIVPASEQLTVGAASEDERHGSCAVASPWVGSDALIRCSSFRLL